MKAQRGSAVLMAMLIVAAVATLVAGAMWQQNALMRETAAEAAHAQARWLIRGAIDWAGVILREDGRTSSVDHRGEPWAVPLADTRLNENDGRAPAYIAGFVQDEQAKLNLRNLASSQGIERKEIEAFERLLGVLGLNTALAEPIARRMQEALAAAAQREPALALASVEEALRVEGVDAQALERLREFVTVLPERTRVNANTAAAEVLAAQVQASACRTHAASRPGGTRRTSATSPRCARASRRPACRRTMPSSRWRRATSASKAW